MLIPSTFIGSSLAAGRAAMSATPSFALPAGASSLHMAVDGHVSSVASVVIPMALSVARGGGTTTSWMDAFPSSSESITHFCTAKGAFDIGRAKMRLEGLQAYGTICALLMNATLRLFSSVDEPSSEDVTPEGKWQNRAFNLFLLAVIISVLFGSYTTIVFSMIALYSKQALGRGIDSNFIDFYIHTHGIRESGFRAFLYALGSFQGAFILSLFLKYKGERRKWIVFSAIAISLLSARRWTYVMMLASKFIFSTSGS